MERKSAQYIGVKGMNQDLNISKFDNQFIKHGYNIRLDNVDDDSLLIISNEKGNEKKLDISGCCIGYCAVDDYIVLFITYNTSEGDNTENDVNRLDRIVRIDKN
jgi:hypothetical protein